MDKRIVVHLKTLCGCEQVFNLPAGVPGPKWVVNLPVKKGVMYTGVGRVYQNTHQREFALKLIGENEDGTTTYEYEEVAG